MFKLRAVWININYRYVHDELRYLFTNADLVALVHQRQFSPRVAALLPELPDLRHVVVIDDDTEEPDPSTDAVDFEDAVADGAPERDFAPALGRRHLHPLHRRDHRHAQGRRVAPRATSSSPSAAASTP